MVAKGEPGKSTLEDVLARLGPFFIVIMSFPLMGMVAAIGVLIYVNPRNLPWLIGMVAFFMTQYVLTMYIMYRKMRSLGKTRKGSEAQEGGPKV